MHEPLRKKMVAGAAAKGVAVELCSGLGGIGIGLRALGFHVIKAYDSWDEAVAIYNHNSPNEVAGIANLLNEKGRQLIRADHARIGEIDLLAAGPPCKGFSQLRNGHHDGRNGHNRVLAVMPEYLAILRPRLFLIENVPDLIRHRDGRTLAHFLERIERPARRLRYRVEYKVYDAALFGTPQARRRILIFGVRGGGKERLPEPDVTITTPPRRLRMLGNVPDPFNPTTRVRYELQASADVAIEVFDVRSRLVRALFHGAQPAGVREVLWDGRANDGVALPSGVYFVRVTSPHGTGVERVTLVR